MTLTNKQTILYSITYNDVKGFLERQKSRETKPYRGFNSNVAHEPLQEIQIDLGTFTDSAPDNNGFKYAFVASDIFLKLCHVVPIKDKQTEGSVRAMKEILDVIGIPKVLYHDNLGWPQTRVCAFPMVGVGPGSQFRVRSRHT